MGEDVDFRHALELVRVVDETQAGLAVDFVEQFEVAHVFHVQAHDLVLGVATGEGGELQHDDEKDAQSHNFFSFSARFTQIAAQVLSFFHTFVKHLDEHLAGTGSIGLAVD